MSEIKNKIILLVVLITLIFGGSYILNDINFSNITLVNVIIIIIVVMILIVGVNMILSSRNNKELKSRDRLFNSLVQNSDTIYLMYEYKTKKIVYMSKNIPEVLAIDESENTEDYLNVINDIFKLPILKDSLRSWDEESDFVSQMLSYVNSNTLNKIWIKVKLYPTIDKKNHYLVILISNVSNEHEQQHLLVTQASDIKSREKQLNQITASSYDVEMNVNLTSGEFTLRNLKNDLKYFGDNRIGNYEYEINEIIDQYVNVNDAKEVTNMLSLNNLIKLAEESDLEPISIRYQLNGNNNIWLESTIFFTNNKSEIIITILTKNVTENAEYMRIQNQKLENALMDAKKANKAKSEFLAIMSHEIRTPLNAIIGLSESALTEELPRTVHEDIESINSASNNVLQIIDGILDISKIETGNIKLVEKEYDVAKLFKNLETITIEQIGDKKINLEMDVAKDIPSKLFGDSGKLKQVMINILNNAVKYTSEGTIKVTGKCEKGRTNAKLIISVSDTGCGIERDKLGKIFDDSKKTDNKDYIEGMGLTIAKNLIDLLKGEIEVESKVGEGSTFTVTVNQKIISDETIGQMTNYDPQKKRVNTFNASGSKILVVDDNKLNLRVAERLLKKYNIEVTLVESGQECINIINDNQDFDLILLDQMMPNMSGTETLHKLKNIKNFNIPVIVLTADAIVGKKEEYLNEGFDDYLSKPIEIDTLTDILKKHLKH
ncbi:MAG: response regulator [Bacilli bacterium]